MDSIDYTLFPNFHPWGALNRIVYRFRPNGDDHRSSIMDVLLLAPFAGERPPPAPVHWLAADETLDRTRPELGLLAKVFDQDVFNIGKVQLGLETTAKPGVTLGNYQESKIRWLHHKLGEWVEEGRRERHPPPVHRRAVRARRRRHGPGDARRPARGGSPATAAGSSGELREADPQLCGWVAGTRHDQPACPTPAPTATARTAERNRGGELMELSLKGKVALVTGGSYGLGVVWATALAEAGADVALTARSGDLLEEVAADLAGDRAGGEHPPRRRHRSRPTSSGSSPTPSPGTAQIDILVNNAGINENTGRSSEQTTSEHFRHAIDVDLARRVALRPRGRPPHARAAAAGRSSTSPRSAAWAAPSSPTPPTTPPRRP